VTVVIPTYNHASYLGEAVESALGQTERGVQVVVVDDGSTDDTPSLVAARWRARVRYVRQDNRGLAAARNAGLACAEGEYVTVARGCSGTTEPTPET
jgi:glycosyltransferase involved in cell wall biosynthesis